MTRSPRRQVRRALPLWVETVRQAKRRRTAYALGFLVLLPLILVGAFALAGPGDTQPGQTNLVDLATSGAVNFTIFTVFASAGFLLVVIVALFCGDTVASEASWSSLRYLLAAPVPRGRLLRQKLLVALGYSALSLVLLPAVALVVGRLAYGWHPVHTPLGDTYSANEGLGAVGLVIVSNILDAITALGSLREVLPTHYQYAWTDALTIPVQYDAMVKGVAGALAYSAVFLVLAWRHFANKDIVS